MTDLLLDHPPMSDQQINIRALHFNIFYVIQNNKYCFHEKRYHLNIKNVAI